MLNKTSNLVWLFFLFLMIYLVLAILYIRSEKRLENLEKRMQIIENMQPQVGKK